MFPGGGGSMIRPLGGTAASAVAIIKRGVKTMRRNFLVVAVVLMFGAAASLVAQAKPDFSGKWVADAAAAPAAPPAGAAAGAAGAAAASITHLPEKSGLACAAKLAAAPNISTTATTRKFRRIVYPSLNDRSAVTAVPCEAGSYPHTRVANIKKTLRNLDNSDSATLIP